MTRFPRPIPARPGVAALAVALAVAPIAVSPASAHDATLGPIRIGHAWTAPAEAGATAVVAMPLLNAGDEADRLVAIRSDAAERVEFRRGDDRPAAVELAPKRPVALGPRGAHAALIGLRRAAREGDRIPVTLVFERAGTLAYEVYVETTPGK